MDRLSLNPNNLTAEEVIEALGLVPLPEEGGFFRETYRSKDYWTAEALAGRYPKGEARCAATCIYYLITPEIYSALHRVRSDEIFHFYRGDGVEMMQLSDDGVVKTIRIGCQFEQGEQCQVVVPAGVWQGCRLAPGGKWALMGATVAPGFEFADFELASPRLLEEFPRLAPELAPFMPNHNAR